ncbi:hypothetical protein POVWA2_004860 [Plasmodium ovale wallikeri]|uniref:Uncharacterized protein n=1 Tax=Plasmodium ovale wallikeri TaxID=864142 RepID=A0A1A8YI76_PLAOA|nr:hypothetical protein POVWA1_004800 [Plasmodium ovale wallikeri]SBT31565.1 hypothetical protein POVWA2_004860 [Plasmodium ovale wallikeri]
MTPCVVLCSYYSWNQGNGQKRDGNIPRVEISPMGNKRQGKFCYLWCKCMYIYVRTAFLPHDDAVPVDQLQRMDEDG